jgi:general stress protein YciG
MAGKLPWFQFFAEDWLTSPLYLETDHAVHGLFWDVLSQMWTAAKCGITEQTVYSLSRRGLLLTEADPSMETDRKAMIVMGDLVPHPDPSADGLMTHPKLYGLWLGTTERVQRAREAGRKGGKQSAAKRAERARSQAVAQGSLEQPSSYPDPDPDPEKTQNPPNPPDGGELFGPGGGKAKGGKKPKKDKAIPPSVLAAVKKFVVAYPGREDFGCTNETVAKKFWILIRDKIHTAEEIMGLLEAWKGSDEWRRGYVCAPDKFLTRGQLKFRKPPSSRMLKGKGADHGEGRRHELDHDDSAYDGWLNKGQGGEQR